MGIFSGLFAATGRKATIVAVIVLVQIWAFNFLIPPGTFSKAIHLPQTPNPSPSSSSSSSKTKGRPWNDPDRPLVAYAYHETDVARENLKFFIQKGLHGAADFLFIINGETEDSSLIPSDLPNVRVVQRPNTCFDLGGIGDVLRKEDLWKGYKKFITMNASLRGPFLPAWGRNRCWTDLFLNMVTEKVKLVGTSVNCDPRPHVQSMLFATDYEGMSVLLDKSKAMTGGVDDHWGKKEDPVGLSACYETMDAAIHAEVGTTSLLRNHGYEVDALLAGLHGHKGLDEYCEEEQGVFTDVLYDDAYFGFNIHPYEVLFFKANRGIDPKMLEHLTRWHLGRGDSSWDSCG